jgi:hypothetical protein
VDYEQPPSESPATGLTAASHSAGKCVLNKETKDEGYVLEQLRNQFANAGWEVAVRRMTGKHTEEE